MRENSTSSSFQSIAKERMALGSSGKRVPPDLGELQSGQPCILGTRQPYATRDRTVRVLTLADLIRSVESEKETATKDPAVPVLQSPPSDEKNPSSDVASRAPRPASRSRPADNSNTTDDAGDDEEDAEYNIERASYSFPERLMDLLEDEAEPEALWWLDGGDCFCVAPKPFGDRVLNKHFQGTKFESFTRKLNRWYVALCELDWIGSSW
jgi:hypothetical protein